MVTLENRETLTSRIGATLEYDTRETALGAGTVFGFGHVVHDLADALSSRVNGTQLTQSGTGDWVELGGGFSLASAENNRFFGQIAYREAFADVDGDAISASVGWRGRW